MRIITAKESRSLDNLASNGYSIPPTILMENSAFAAIRCIEKEWEIKGSNFLVFCGPGQNGGDGLAIARQIYSKGGVPLVLLFAKEEGLKGAGRLNKEIVDQLPIEVYTPKTREEIASFLYEADYIIDALFGTGLNRDPEGSMKAAIEEINSSLKPVCSVDLPSGLQSDTGAPLSDSVKASFTITFGLPKWGMLLYPGVEKCGKIYLSHISLPDEIYNADSIKGAINRPPPLPKRDTNGHKGSFGSFLVVGGAENYYGAPLFSAKSLLKSGAGYARVAAPSSMIPTMASIAPEVVFHPLEQSEEGHISSTAIEQIEEIAEHCQGVIVGPGLSRGGELTKLIEELLLRIDKPLLIDGDGLYPLANMADSVKKRKYPTILTPHTAEMAKMSRLSLGEVEASRVQVAREAATYYNASVVLKGAHSLIAFPDERVFINCSGNSGMGTPGSGDALNGAIMAAFGLGLDLEEAVRAGVYIHGAAGDLAAQTIGEDGLTVFNIIEALPAAVKRLRHSYQTSFAQSMPIEVL